MVQTQPFQAWDDPKREAEAQITLGAPVTVVVEVIGCCSSVKRRTAPTPAPGGNQDNSVLRQSTRPSRNTWQQGELPAGRAGCSALAGSLHKRDHHAACGSDRLRAPSFPRSPIPGVRAD